jgi:hypothetical protein
MAPWTSRKTWLSVVTLAVVVYVADAIYPTWTWECRGRGYTSNDLSLPVSALSIPELGDEGDRRAMRVSHPQGCSIHANNFARRVFDWWSGD